MLTPSELSILRKNAWPKCEFDDCVEFNAEEGKSGAFANALVPLISPGMPIPYAWVISCEDCKRGWQSANPDVRPLQLVR
jgi:hypothetical protein